VPVTRGCRDRRATTNLRLGSVAVRDLPILSCCLSEGRTCRAVLHVAALTAERCLAVCFPLTAKAFVTKRRVIAVLWVFAFLSAGPFFFPVSVEQLASRTDFSCECRPTLQAMGSGPLATIFRATTSYFVLPVICLNVLCGFIGRELWQSNARLRGPTRSSGRRGTTRASRSWVSPSSIPPWAGGPWLGPGLRGHGWDWGWVSVAGAGTGAEAATAPLQGRGSAGEHPSRAAEPSGAPAVHRGRDFAPSQLWLHLASTAHPAA